MQEMLCPSAGIVLTRVCWYRNTFVGEASLVISPETTFEEQGVFRATSSLLLSTAKSWSEADTRLQLKSHSAPWERRLLVRERQRGESVTRDSLPPPVQSVLGNGRRFPALISLCCPGTGTA